jgi:hypothetical protein
MPLYSWFFHVLWCILLCMPSSVSPFFHPFLLIISIKRIIIWIINIRSWLEAGCLFLIMDFHDFDYAIFFNSMHQISYLFDTHFVWIIGESLICKTCHKAVWETMRLMDKYWQRSCGSSTTHNKALNVS